MAAIEVALQTSAVAPLFLRASELPSGAHELELLSRACEREALLGRRMIVIEVDDSDALEMAGIRSLAERFRGVLLVSARELLTFNSDGGYHELRNPSLAERRAMWRGALGNTVALPGGELDLLATQFALDSKQITRVVRNAARESDIGPALWRGAVVAARPQLDGLATRIEAKAAWSDLVLPKQLEASLREICDQLRFRHRVHEEWGLARGARRNTAITALFHGPSGTGKTLAAEVIATETGLDLYHIDLSRIVDKYVGETEKRLRSIFEAADKSGAILLFDEADALFGKRGDVERATDRWANLEVSYLLQRMETYRGLAILTTNAKAAISASRFPRPRFAEWTRREAFRRQARQCRGAQGRGAGPPSHRAQTSLGTKTNARVVIRVQRART